MEVLLESTTQQNAFNEYFLNEFPESMQTPHHGVSPMSILIKCMKNFHLLK